MFTHYANQIPILLASKRSDRLRGERERITLINITSHTSRRPRVCRVGVLSVWMGSVIFQLFCFRINSCKRFEPKPRLSFKQACGYLLVEVNQQEERPINTQDVSLRIWSAASLCSLCFEDERSFSFLLLQYNLMQFAVTLMLEDLLQWDINKQHMMCFEGLYGRHTLYNHMFLSSRSSWLHHVSLNSINPND